MTSDPRIAVSGLTVRYNDVTAVDSISFDIQPGELVTLLGPSGCGKTTTLRALAGLEDPTGGTIRLGGETVYSSAERRNVPSEKRGLSMVFQSYAIWPHMTVYDNAAGRSGGECSPGSGPGADDPLRRPSCLAFVGRPAATDRGGEGDRILPDRAAVR